MRTVLLGRRLLLARQLCQIDDWHSNVLSRGDRKPVEHVVGPIDNAGMMVAKVVAAARPHMHCLP